MQTKDINSYIATEYKTKRALRDEFLKSLSSVEVVELHQVYISRLTT